MTILLADAGSTKTDWVCLTENQCIACIDGSFSGPGISPVHNDSESICNILMQARDAIGHSFDHIRFFGTGVGSPELKMKIEECVASVFNCPDIKADSDMAAAARAVLGNSPGIACIMGTGSNSCHYNGSAIDRKSASLGFILDDDGGGVAFGKRLLADIFKNVAPGKIIELFHSSYRLSTPDVVRHIYREPSPNRWIAGFMPFIVDHIENPYIANLVDSQIERFISREFAIYPDSELTDEGVGFVGSVACLFEDRIRKAFYDRGWKVRNFTPKPLEELIRNEMNSPGAII
ncbi:MAG: hypothetical protein J5995_09575 [Muribaculaceae bacterium]|nr:hypothetical protein [Muribaculaceae bacterium]